jgi:hypothetical protein
MLLDQIAEFVAADTAAGLFSIGKCKRFHIGGLVPFWGVRDAMRRKTWNHLVHFAVCGASPHFQRFLPGYLHLPYRKLLQKRTAFDILM